MRGYFAIGIDRVNKAGNVGNLMRTAHAFGAAFTFTIAEEIDERKEAARGRHKTDTSKSEHQVPHFEYDGIDELALPNKCQLVAIEFDESAIELPSFRHPTSAAYILGSERFSVSDEVMAHCHHVIKIPTKFSLNVATAGAIVMYDRMISMGKFAERAVTSMGEALPIAPHVRGGPIQRLKKRSQI